MTTRTDRRPDRLDPDELAALEGQRDFLLASLRDLDREHEAGDLDDDDYETLRDDYTARAAEVLRAIEEQHAAFAAARRPRRPGRTLLWAAAVVAFAVVAGVVVAGSLGARRSGDSASGGITAKESPSQRAQQCIPLISPAAPKAALDCFKEVLDDDPRNPVANTWLAWQLGLTTSLTPPDLRGAVEQTAARHIERALAADPSYSYARAFRAILAYRRGDAAAAKRYLEDFEAHDPSADARAVIDQMKLAENIEAALAEGDPSSTTTSTTGTGSTGTTSTTAPG